MILSSSHHFLYCHNPKTGGTSFRNSLKAYIRPYEQSILFKLIRRNPYLELKWPFYDFLNRPHTTLARAQALIPTQQWETLTTFGIIREPLDWLGSCYRHYLGFRRSNPQVTMSINCDSFDSFIEQCVSLGPGRPTQVNMFLSNDGKLLVDILGLFSELDLFFTKTTSLFGLAPHKLDQLNQNQYYRPSDLCCSTSLLAKVQEIWQPDYALFDLLMSSKGFETLRGHRLASAPLPTIDLETYDPWESILTKHPTPHKS